MTIRKNTVVRYRAGIKSKVLEKVKKGTVCQYVGAVDDDWIEVITPSGYQGYVKKNAASDVYTAVPEDTYTEVIPVQSVRLQGEYDVVSGNTACRQCLY